jgi:Bardet-Biedl syndrome 2 protein
MLSCYLDDGKHPCLTCATSAGKIFIHNPYTSEDEEYSISDNQVKFLNINQSITGLSAGNLDPSNDTDALFVGSATNLLAY